MEKYCMHCGGKIEEGEKFCQNCGASTEDAKTEVVNNIKMLPQFIWIKGSYIANEIQKNLKDLY